MYVYYNYTNIPDMCIIILQSLGNSSSCGSSCGGGKSNSGFGGGYTVQCTVVYTIYQPLNHELLILQKQTFNTLSSRQHQLCSSNI